MREWFTAKELAGLKLSELPESRYRISLQAQRQHWIWRRRSGVGGGKEYHVENLSTHTRAELAKKLLSQTALVAQQQDCARKPSQPITKLTPKLQSKADAKAWILNAYRSYQKFCDLKGRAAMDSFVFSYNQCELTVPHWVSGEIATISTPSLYRWQDKSYDELGGLYVKHPSMIEKNDQLKEIMLALLYQRPNVSAAQLMRVLRAKLPADEVPSYRSVQRYLADYRQDNAQVLMAVSNPDGWRSKYQAAAGSASEHITALNQVWEFDSTPADLILADGKRHAIIGVIDVYSRRVKFHLSKTSRASAVASLTRKAIKDWGLPHIAKTDNGADYVSRHMTRVFTNLGIVQDVCPPFSPEKKPHIERVFQSLLHDIFELLPGFIGHSVADRKAIESRRSFAQRLMKKDAEVEVKMQPEELQDFLDKWAKDIYERDQHSALKMSPFEKATSWTGEVRRLDNERALDVLLMPAADGDGTRQVTKKGLRVAGTHYIAAELGGFEGKRVQVFEDEADFGLVYVFEEDGTFLCKAIAPERTGADRQAVAAEQRARQKKVIAEGQKELKAAARALPLQDAVDAVLGRAAEQSANIIALPKPVKIVSTQALDEAAKASSTLQPSVTDIEREKQRKFLTDLYAQKPKQESADDRFARAYALEQQINEGEPISQANQSWLEGYRTSPEYRSKMMMIRNFGADVVLKKAM